MVTLVSRVAASSHPRKRAGFTLIELLVYMMIISVVLVAATSLSFEFARTKAKATSLVEVNRNARLAVSRLVTEIREANGVNAGDSVFGANPSRISLGSSDAAVDPTVIFATGGQLWIQQGANPALPLTSSKVNVDEFVLRDVSAASRSRIVAVHLKLSYRTDLQMFAAATTLDTTAQVKKADGFSN